MKKTIISLALAVGLPAVAVAAPISLPGGPVYFQFNNMEQISPVNSITVPGGSIDVNGDGVNDTPTNEGNWGVFNVSSMQYGAVSTPHNDISGGSTFFSDFGPSDSFGFGQISGIFYGITNLATCPTGYQLCSTGGWLDIYWEDNGADDITSADLNGTYAPTNRTAANQAGIFTDGTLLVRLAFAPGIVSGSSTINITGTVAPSTSGFSGQADSFADVMDINNDGVIDSADGAWAGKLNTDWFWVDVDGDGVLGETGEQRDLRFSNFYNQLANWNGGDPTQTGIFGARSNDPGRAYAAPEPGALALMSIGLLGLGFASRRRKA